MKKILFFISFLFSVVCFAAPPPDLVPDPVTAQCAYVVQDNVDFTVYTVEAREVEFTYLANFELRTCYSEFAEQTNEVVVPVATVTDANYFRLSDLNKPPSLQFTDGLINNRQFCSINRYNYCENRQNSNYGYPFGADYNFS